MKKQKEYHVNLKSTIKIDTVKNTINNRTLLVGSSFLVKLIFCLNFFSRMPNRDFYIITKSPPEQYSNFKIKTKETGEKINRLSEYENAIIVFDEILGTLNSKYKDEFFITGRHNVLDIYYLSQSYFDLPKGSIGNINIKKNCLLKHSRI